MTIYYIIFSIIFLYLLFNVIYLLFFAVSGLFRKRGIYSSVKDKKKIVLLIPAYKEDSIIIETARKAILQNYPKDKFDVVVIADQLKEDTLNALSQLPVKLTEVSFRKSTKAKSLKYALRQLPDRYYDIVLILDSDNIMEQGCLEKVNHAFYAGSEVVQLHRTAKNKNTPTAILDAASEEINNHIFRKGHRALGLSSALIGSGMAFRYDDLKTLMEETDIEDNPGEDREIARILFLKGKVCEYIENGLVYDEKVQSGQVLEKQRTRWLSAQLQYAKRFWIAEFFKTFSCNIHYFDYAVQTLLLPRVLLLAVTLLMVFLSLLLSTIAGTGIFPGTFPWLMVVLGCLLSLLLSVCPYLPVRELIGALIRIPQTCWFFIRALLKSRPNQKEFIRTPKEFVQE